MMKKWVAEDKMQGNGRHQPLRWAARSGRKGEEEEAGR
jgi:hypothetical protein